MGRKKGSFKKKDEFDGLPDDFKDAVAGSSPEEIKKRVSQIALLDCETKATLKEDGDVAQAREALKQLMEPYRADLKAFKLKIKFCKRCLDDKGVNSTSAKEDPVDKLKNPAPGTKLTAAGWTGKLTTVS